MEEEEEAEEKEEEEKQQEEEEDIQLRSSVCSEQPSSSAGRGGYSARVECLF